MTSALSNGPDADPSANIQPSPIQSAGAQENFTDNQWYFHKARQTVFFTAFASIAYNEDSLIEVARQLLDLAPQLCEGFDGGAPGRVPDTEILRQLVNVTKVEDLAPYPDCWPVNAPALFDRGDLPLFRIHAAVLNDGADGAGRISAVAVIATHALLEGADAAQLTRAKTVERSQISHRPDAIPTLTRWAYKLLAILAAPAQLLIAQLLVPATTDISFKALAVERTKLRRVANGLKIPQRTLMFALVTYALNDGGEGFSQSKIKTIFADLDAASTQQTNDSFFQFRMISTKFPVKNSFAEFAHTIDTIMKEAEARDVSGTQLLLNAMFVAHRNLIKLVPFFYTDRTFRYDNGYHLTLSLVPPQRPHGAFGDSIMEPINCGSYHPGLNVCVFTPGRKFVTFNFSMRQRHLTQVDQIAPLLDQLDEQFGAPGPSAD